VTLADAGRKVIFAPGHVRVSGAGVRGIVPTPPPTRSPGSQGHGAGGQGKGHPGKGKGNGRAALVLALAAVSATSGKVVPSSRVGLAWYTGTGAPANTLGALNEFYYDQAGTRDVYQKVLSGTSPAFRSALNTQVTNSATCSALLPSGVAPFDLLVAFGIAYQASTNVPIATPAGWTLRAATTALIFGTGVSAVFTRLADGSEGASLALTTTAQASYWNFTVAAFPTADFDQIATGALTTSTTITGPSVTPTASGDLLLQIMVGVSSNGTSLPTVTPPAGFTGRIASYQANGTGVEMSSDLLSGGSGTPTGTFANTLSGSEPWLAFTVALKPGTQAPSWARAGSLSA
jgi:hypothetical protein